MKEMIYNDPDLGEIIFRKNPRSRRLSIRVNSSGVSVTVPRVVPFKIALAFLISKKDWIIKTRKKQQGKIAPISTEEIEKLRPLAKKILPLKLQTLAKRYGFQYNKVFIKNNTSNWGSCSTKKNINLNINLLRTPELLQDYVILHELCHLRYMNHGQEFHALLENLCKDNLSQLVSKGDQDAIKFNSELKPKSSVHRSLEKKLKEYRLK